MKKKILIFTAFMLVVSTSKYVALGSIDLYQKYISPNKGWKCAYAVAHVGELSCSEFGKVAIQNWGTVRGLNQLNDRFKGCGIAYAALGGQNNTANAGCCDGPSGPPTMIPLQLIDGNKAEGTLTFAYEYIWTVSQPTPQWAEANEEATKRCKAWGFSSASFFGTGLKTCVEPSSTYISCVRYRVVHKCQCGN